MKHLYIFLSVIFLLPFFATAQSNYKAGYVVTLKGDTLKGFVDYREWEKNPAKVSFKSNSGDVREFNIRNALAFAVAGLEYFERDIVIISEDQVEANKLSGKIDSNYRTDTVFLHVLTKGKHLALYSYRDDIKNRFYLAETGQLQPQELEFHAYYDADNANVHYVNRYRTQLQYEAQKNGADNSGMQSAISQARYDEDELIKIVTKINGDSGTQFASKNLLGTRWFAGLGASYNDMSFSGDIEFPDSYKFDPRAAVGIDLFTNKVTQRLFVRFELSFTSDSHDSKNSYQRSELKFNQYTVAFTPQAYYNFYSSESLKVFAGGGIGINISSYPNTYYIYQGGIDLNLIKMPNYPDYHKIWESVILKGGVVLGKNIEIYGAYTPPTALTDNYESFVGKVVSYQFGLNYLFGIK